MNLPQPAISVRFAQLEDSDRIAQLCGQLGYEVSVEQAQQRLEQLQQDSQCNVVYVAETAPASVVGWIHLYVCQVLTADRLGVIGGLVVDASFRQQGIGRLLLRSVKQWVDQQGCNEIIVRSNVRRQIAHQFYERNGFKEIKRSVVFRQPFTSSSE